MYFASIIFYLGYYITSNCHASSILYILQHLLNDVYAINCDERILLSRSVNITSPVYNNISLQANCVLPFNYSVFAGLVQKSTNCRERVYRALLISNLVSFCTLCACVCGVVNALTICTNYISVQRCAILHFKQPISPNGVGISESAVQYLHSAFIFIIPGFLSISHLQAVFLVVKNMTIFI